MANYKYKLSELAKKDSADKAEKELGIPKSRFKVGQVTYSKDGTSKSEITDIDPETGAVKWTITQLPGFDKLYDELDDLVSTAKRTYVKTKDDKKFRDFYDEIRVIRNKVRTHLRNEYPDQYKRITRIGESKLNEMIDLVHVMEPDGSLYGTGQVVGVEKDKTIVRFDGETVKRFPSNRVVPVQEEEVDEVSLSNAAGAYLTPYAFRKKGQKPNDEVYKELGYKVVKEAMDGGRLFDYFNKKYIVDDHFHSDDSYIVKREPSGKDQYVIFDYDKDKDQFQIRQMGGYRIDRSEAMKAGMKETSSLARVGMDAYMVDGNYSPTPISIKGLKDVVDHVMGGLDREAKAQQDYYARRGPVSGIGNLDEGDTYEKMAAKGKKAGNLKQGTVRKRLNIPKGEKIPLSKITKEISRIKKMKNPSEKNKKYLKALNLAKTLKTTTNVNEDKDPGATLGPGPKAGPDGVDDNYYVKAFKYKLVPKKNGTYVQKGSGLEVKKLF